ncbi:MAG: hypothetical protein R6U28_05265 [Cyclonatronaceae bacterium]
MIEPGRYDQAYHWLQVWEGAEAGPRAGAEQEQEQEQDHGGIMPAGKSRKAIFD